MFIWLYYIALIITNREGFCFILIISDLQRFDGSIYTENRCSITPIDGIYILKSVIYMCLVVIFAVIKRYMKSSTFIKKKHLVKQVRSVDPSTGEIFEDNTEQTFEVGSFYYYRGVKNGIFEIFDLLSGNDFRVLLFLIKVVQLTNFLITKRMAF